jgi:hypothetical protein
MATRRRRSALSRIARNAASAPDEPFGVLGPTHPDRERDDHEDGRVDENIFDRARRQARPAPKARKGGTRRRG